MRKKTLKAFMLMICLLPLRAELLCQNDTAIGRYDIVISEIMAKPSPEIGLPAVEYIELHSRLPHPCTLQNWRLTLGATSKSLPDIPLDSCGYAVLIAQKFEEDFSPFCENLFTLSSLSITDGGQSLTLYDQHGEVIHHVSFKPSWHRERIKQEGGWSLEMIDEKWPCRGAWNWDSSADPAGGTPGRPNAIRNTLHDNTAPQISGVTMLDSTTLRVHFTKTVSLPETAATMSFTVHPELVIRSVTEVPPDFSSRDVRFTEMPNKETRYAIRFSGEVADCGGNVFRINEETSFGTACQPAKGDLVINEVLTNPLDGEPADYLEIYNRSNHIIDLKDVKVGYGGDTIPQKAMVAARKGWQILPEAYAVLCRMRETTLLQYVCKDENRLLECDSLPDFAIGKGTIHLTDRSLRPIDRLNYSEEMHYANLLTTKGVSLERLSPEQPTQDANNWRSAAESAGFGTPGYENSQAGGATAQGTFHAEPAIFSPDNDGFDDFSEFVCAFKEEENRVTIILYDNRGRPVKHLVNNMLCGIEARFRWDGDDDNGQPAPAGMFVAQMEYWNLRSHQKKRKRLVVSIYR